MLRFHVSNKRERQQFEHVSGPIEFGRGPKREPTPRCVIQDDLYVSKDHVRVEEIANGKVRVENLSQRNPIWLTDNTNISPGGQKELLTPARLTVGETIIDIEPGSSKPSSYDSLATIQKPVRPSKLIPGGAQALRQLGDTPDPEKLTNWFETLITVQRAAAGSPEFYDQTAQAIVDLVGLDCGMVLLRRGEAWVAAASVCKGSPSEPPEFSNTILEQVLRERQTFYQSSVQASTTSSLQGVEAVVASPIFDGKDQVVGVLYGIRNRMTESQHFGIGRLEAQVVQLLASAVGVGLARLEQEAEAGRLRVQFEQFFSPNLARELQRNPRLLEGMEREVTILFVDIRGFSRLAERLGPHDTCRLVREMMTHLTNQVRQFEGVVVDYAGDGLMAMWNAPADQKDHAKMACRAALAILSELPRISEAWTARLGGPISLGVGLNTGPALVGNTGSMQKFKYGPLGHTVNLASRVEGATKHLGIPILLTGSTHALVGDSFAARRLCRARVVGMSGPVDLYELYAEKASAEWKAQRDAYETGLALFEAGQWAACIKAIYPLLSTLEGHYDIPCLNLLMRAIECLRSPPRTFDPVLDFTMK